MSADTPADFSGMTRPTQVIWVLHLTGGARASWGEDGKPAPVRIEPPLSPGTTFEFEGVSLDDVIKRCTALGLQVFGVGAYTQQLEIDGIIPAQWRPVHYLPHSAWLCHDAKTTWGQIAYAAGKAKSGKLWDCAARIAYQIETCIARLRQLSDGYANQLSTLLARRQFPHGHRIEDLWTQSVFLCIQSFLTDACVLRDYLAEFAAAFHYRILPPPRIRTLAGLLEYIKKHVSSEDSLTAKVKQACDAGGWLSQLGSYRNLVVHSAPLALAQRRLWVWCKTHRLSDAAFLPTVRFPLPAGSCCNYDGPTQCRLPRLQRTERAICGTG